MKHYHPPFHIVPIPLDAHSMGPARAEDTVTTVYEIWDGANQTLQTFDNQHAAERALTTLRAFTDDWPPYGSFRWACMQFRITFSNLIYELFK